MPSAVAATRSDQLLDPRATLGRLRRLARLDASVFSELRDDPTQTLAAALVAAAAILLGGLGGAVWLLTGVEGVHAGPILLRSFFLGGVAMGAAWFGWLTVTQLVIERVYARPIERGALVRVMGFAAAPAAAALVLVLPGLHYAVATLALLGWFALNTLAIEAVAGGAARRDVFIANAAGFVVCVVALSVLADAVGVGAGVFAPGANLAALR